MKETLSPVRSILGNTHMKNPYLFGAALLLIGIGVGYLAHTPPKGAPVSGHTMMNFSQRTQGGTNLLSGTVASMSTTTLTLNTRDGSSHVILLTPTTTVSKSIEGSLSDITTGASLLVSGNRHADGSVAATLLQLRPSPVPMPQ